MKHMRPLVTSLHRPLAAGSGRLAASRCSRSMGSAADEERAHLSAKQRALMALEDKYGAHNYHPLPVRRRSSYRKYA